MENNSKEKREVLVLSIKYSDANEVEEILCIPEPLCEETKGHETNALWDGDKKHWELQLERILFLDSFDSEAAVDIALEVCRKYYEVVSKMEAGIEIEEYRSSLRGLIDREKSEDWWKGMLVIGEANA